IARFPRGCGSVAQIDAWRIDRPPARRPACRQHRCGAFRGRARCVDRARPRRTRDGRRAEGLVGNRARERGDVMTQRHYFGTDGIRGRVGQPPITPELILKLGWAAGRTLAAADGSRRGERPSVLIGKDTRISGYLLEAALESGFSAAGVDVYLCV